MYGDICYEWVQYFQSVLNEFCDINHAFYLQLLLFLLYLDPYVYDLAFI